MRSNAKFSRGKAVDWNLKLGFCEHLLLHILGINALTQQMNKQRNVFLVRKGLRENEPTTTLEGTDKVSRKHRRQHFVAV